MIVVWPLIVSKTVNPNIIPGVCKSLEKYIYAEEIDEVVEAANQFIKSRNVKNSVFLALTKMGGKSKLKLESIEPGKTIEDYLTEDWSLDDWEEDYIEEAKKDSQQGVLDTTTATTTTDRAAGTKKTITTSPRREDPEKREKKTPYKDAYKKAKAEHDYKQKVVNEPPKIGIMSQSSISAEPTWNTVTDQVGNTRAIGVKVVPFVIDNEQSLVKLMTLDRYRNKLSKNVHVQARKIMRFMHRIANFTWKKTVGLLFSWTGFVDKDLVAGTVTKNWKNDIILQNTAFDKKMFILLNKMDMEDDFVQSASGVNKLFKLGWTSFIIADDINKVATFCMKTYKGMCSMINYGFLYSDARTQGQVYTDIEDIRKSAGPLFRMKRRKKTMITDNLAQQKLDKYSQDILISESLLNESVIPDMIKQLKDNPKQVASIYKSIASAFKRKDYKKAYQFSKKLNPKNKKLDINKIVDKAKSTNNDYKKHFDLAYRVFKNSLPSLNEQSLKAGSGLMAGIATINKNKNYNYKNDLKKVVMQTRARVKTLEEDNDEFSQDLKIAFAFSILGILIAGTGITILLYSLMLVLPTVGGFVWSVWPFVAVGTVVLYSLKIVAGVAEGGKDDGD